MRAVGLILAAAMAALAAPAAAEPQNSFEALCLEADGDQAATEQTARSLHWRAAPAELVAQYAISAPSTVGFVDFDPALPLPEAGELVIASRGVVTDPAGRTMDLSTCVLVGRAELAATRAWLESVFGAGQYGQHGDVWLYAIEDGAPRSVVDVARQGEDALAEFSRSRPVHSLTLVPEADGRVGLILSIFRVSG